MDGKHEPQRSARFAFKRLRRRIGQVDNGLDDDQPSKPDPQLRLPNKCDHSDQGDGCADQVSADDLRQGSFGERKAIAASRDCEECQDP